MKYQLASKNPEMAQTNAGTNPPSAASVSASARACAASNVRRDAVDTIVWATGFAISFPFLDRDLFEWEEGIPKRVFGMMAPTVAGLYVFGVLQPRGGAGPLISRGSELLARLARIQSSADHPIAIDLARVRRAAARHLVGVSETMREIAGANRILDVYSWRMKRRASRDAGPTRAAAPERAA